MKSFLEIEFIILNVKRLICILDQTLLVRYTTHLSFIELFIFVGRTIRRESFEENNDYVIFYFIIIFCDFFL